jgi:hypothetical protein
MTGRATAFATRRQIAVPAIRLVECTGMTTAFAAWRQIARHPAADRLGVVGMGGCDSEKKCGVVKAMVS